MQVLTLVFVAFGLLELMDVAVLYGAPGSRKANGVGVFTAWETSCLGCPQSSVVGVVLCAGCDRIRTPVRFGGF